MLAGRDVLVDLPCSGARTILLLLLCFALVAAVIRPRWKQALGGASLTLGAALLANMVRICLLAIGIAFPGTFFGIDVMAQPFHDIIGLLALALGAVPLLIWALHIAKSRAAPTIDERCRHFIPTRLARDGWWLNEDAKKQLPPSTAALALKLAPAIAFLALALVIVNLPRRALDVARRSIAIDLPLHLAGMSAAPVALLAGGKAYFTQFGGMAKKASYGPHQLLVVRTSAPLRHLHAPSDCLRGLGMKVDYLGTRHSPVPSAVYRARTRAGDSFLINVSFVSSDGFVTPNVSQAVWRWLQNPRANWSAVQRISPERESAGSRQQFEQAVIAALDLPSTN
jgi:exosortase/archaeosortase family protein